MLSQRLDLESQKSEHLLSYAALGKRWGCHPEVARQRVIEFGIPIVRFNARAHAVRLSDVIRAEQEATATV
jgi:hypothetical protein